MAVLGQFAKTLIGRKVFLNGSCTCFSRFMSATQDDKPRKPPSSFMLYYQNVRSDLSKKHPEKSIIELSKLVGEQYRKLPDSHLKSLKEESSKLLEEYKKKKAEWEKSLSAEKKAQITAENREHREKKHKRKIKKLQSDNKKPKPPATSFGLFVSDHLEGKNIQSLLPLKRLEAVRKNMEECSALWKNLPEEEKEMYHQRFKEDRELYEAELKDWETKMIEENKLNLIRKSTQQKVKSEQKKQAQGNVVTLSKSKPAKKTVAKKSAVKSATRKTTKKAAEKKNNKVVKKTNKKKGDNSEAAKASDFVSSDSE